MIRKQTSGPARPRNDRATGIGETPAPPWAALAYLAASIAAIVAAGLPDHLNIVWLCFFTAFQVALMSLSVPAAALGASGRGYVSLDRMSLVAAVLVLGPMAAAWVGGASALIWTLAVDPRREPWRERVTRGIGNGGMFLIATLAAGAAYEALGGITPLRDLVLIGFARACVMILVLQAVNELLFLPITWSGMSAAARRHPIDWRSTLNELLIGLSGIIAALAFTDLPPLGFGLYVGFVIVIAVLFKYVVGIAVRERGRADELGAVNRVNQAAHSAVGLDELAEVILREAGGLMDFAAFIIGVYHRKTDEIDVRLNYDAGERHPPNRRKAGGGLLAWTIRHNESVFIRDRRASRHPAIRNSIVHGRTSVSLIAIPINFGDETVGVMSVQDYRPNAFRPRHLRLLENFAGQIAVAIVNTRLFAELTANQQELETRVAKRTSDLQRLTASLEETMRQKESLVAQLEQENRRDPLTALANRRHLDETLDREMQRARRFRHPLALAMGDLDGFKRINDLYGHALGDDVLDRVAGILRGGVRATDLVARYGGEEFVLLLPETDEDQAVQVCEKLRAAIAGAPWADIDPQLAVTMSFGVTELAGQSQTAAALLASADDALYVAKRAGRNRVCRSADAAPPKLRKRRSSP
ncbi:MAG TPA: sensor domain-containing diguanylate cyclase [Gammaproteobacteria bacterium]|nr:sensor domain-containing diguanylate cyclase [Gammaproteobacteria bacterium]